MLGLGWGMPSTECHSSYRKNTKPDINQSQLTLYSWCCGGWRYRGVLEIHLINCSSWRDDVSLFEIDDVSLSDPKVPVDVIEVKRSLEVNLNFYSWSVHLSSGYFGTPGVLCVCSGWFLFPVGSTNTLTKVTLIWWCIYCWMSALEERRLLR